MRDIEILEALGAESIIMLGQGGEAKVYALGADRVARLHRADARLEDALRRQKLLAVIGQSQLPFQTPTVCDVREIGGVVVSIEPRLLGSPTHIALQAATGDERRAILGAHLNGAMELTRVDSRELSNLGLPQVSAEIAGAYTAGLVHVDYALTNTLSQHGALTTVLDFGPSTMVGDIRFNAWAAVAYLDAELSPGLTDEDRALAQDWLDDHQLSSGYGEAKRWLAQYWSFATDDHALMAWCQRVLAR
ncbi:hypothetical protein JHL21_08255 [Devosia sp. WQ 349]|uniref:hypothetical protein n=1 Tax=Devosia sp. WQ 349K1 TaxID=2800329 RepID=UPI0019050C96|nr:hypothetical protein [Devosia sp. WQ 349K1]MBK1794494.1 hypothetical protein [Devosia sp. WQ 349K1]